MPEQNAWFLLRRYFENPAPHTQFKLESALDQIWSLQEDLYAVTGVNWMRERCLVKSQEKKAGRRERRKGLDRKLDNFRVKGEEDLL